MEILIGSVVVGVLLFVGAWALGGVIAVGSWAKGEDARDAAMDRRDEILRQTFDGADVVTYATQPADTLRAPVVIAGAVERGYKLLHEDAGTLTFQRN